jgi:hypothetical protein
MKLNKNMGTTDRIVRALLAGVFTALSCTGTVTGAFGILLLVLAIVLAVTALVSFCPLYTPFKVSTKR